MGVLDAFEQAARALGNAASIHQSATYLHKQVANSIKPKTGNGTYFFSFKMPDKAIVGQTVKVYGNAPPGMVEIYSNAGLEKTVYPDSLGDYAANLFFSNPGTYLMYATWNGKITSDKIYIEVSPQ